MKHYHVFKKCPDSKAEIKRQTLFLDIFVRSETAAFGARVTHEPWQPDNGAKRIVYNRNLLCLDVCNELLTKALSPPTHSP